MSYVPDVPFYGMLSDLGNKITSSVKEYQQKQLLSSLGQDLMSGDYNSAASKALAAGDMGTGLKLLELGRQRQVDAQLPSLLQGPSFGGSGQTQAAPQSSPQGSDLSGAPMPASTSQLPAGMRNNNPGNIKYTSNGAFPGVVGPSKNTDQGDPQAVFATPEAGMAAMYNLAKRKYDGGKTSAASLIAGNMGWTPGNMQAAANVARTMGIGVNDDLRLNDPASAQKFMRALMLQEHGGASRLYNDDMIAGAIGGGSSAPSSAMAFAATKKGYGVPAGIQGQPAQNPADYQDNGEEDKPAASAQLAQGAVPAVPNAAPKAAKSDDGDNAAKIAALRDYQSRLTMGLATATGENAKAAIQARLQQVKDQLTELKPDKEKFQIIRNDDGSITAVNKTDPSQFQNIQIGKPKSQAEYETRKVLADDMGLSGSSRTTFLANGKLPDQARVLRPGDVQVAPDGSVTAKNDGGGKTNNPRSAIGMYMLKYMEENPNATSEDVQRAAQRFQAGGVGLNRFTSGPQGNTIRSFNVLVHHLGTLGDASDALGNGNIKVFNSLAQNYATQTGQPAPTNFEATKQLVGDEIVKAVVGAAGALGDREEAKKTLDKANSPAQLRGVIEQYKKLAAGQLLGLRYQYQSSTGRSEDEFNKMLMPNTAKFLGISAGHGSSESSGDGGSKAAAPTNSRTTKFGVKWSVE